MPKYKITNSLGKTLVVSGDAPPTAETVDEIFKNGIAPADATTVNTQPKQEDTSMGLLGTIKTALENTGQGNYPVPEYKGNGKFGSPQPPPFLNMPKAQQAEFGQNLLQYGLPMLATPLTGGMSIPAAAGLAGVGSVLGQQSSDLMQGKRTSGSDLATQGLINAGLAGAGQAAGVGISKAIQKTIAPFASSYEPGTEALFNKYGMTPTPSMVNRGRAVPLIESLSGKSLFGDKLRIMTENTEQGLVKNIDNLIKGIGDSDPTNAGLLASKGLQNVEKTFYNTKNTLYDAAKIKTGDFQLDPQNTLNVLDETITRLSDVAGKPPAILGKLKALRNGLSKGNALTDQLKKQGFNEQTIQKVLAKQGEQPTEGIDGLTALNTIKNLKNDINFADSNPVTQGYQADLRKISATLQDEFDTSLKQAKPDIADALDKANSFYKENIQKLNSTYGQKIKQFADAKQYDKISQAVLNKNTSLQDIPKIFEVAGEEAKAPLKASLLERLVGESKTNAMGVFTPTMLNKTIKSFGEDKLSTIYTPEEMTTLKDMAKLSYAVGIGQKVSEGSQTGFLMRLLGMAGEMAIKPIVAMKMFLGDFGASRFIASDIGQQWLKGGFKVPASAKTAIPTVTRLGTQATGNYIQNP